MSQLEDFQAKWRKKVTSLDRSGSAKPEPISDICLGCVNSPPRPEGARKRDHST